jgi:hypothetical protein
MGKSSKTPGDYQVGYRRPPVHSRFPPGHSGNPAGKRKGQPTVEEIFMKEAARLVKVKHGDTVEAITKHEAVVRRLFQMGMEGNIAAARLALFGFSQNPPSSAGEACGARCRRRVRASSIFCPRHRTATNERRRGCSTDSWSARYPRASRSARGDRRA